MQRKRKGKTIFLETKKYSFIYKMDLNKLHALFVFHYNVSVGVVEGSVEVSVPVTAGSEDPVGLVEVVLVLYDQESWSFPLGKLGA